MKVNFNMKKFIFVFSALVLMSALSGCDGEQYPTVRVITGGTATGIDIDIGKPYVYMGFDLETIDGGKDLILHFVEGEE